MTEPAASKRPLPVQFGTDVTLNILPTEFSANGWGGVQHVFIQDLTDDALYQKFSARNSAYVSKSASVDEAIQTVDTTSDIPAVTDDVAAEDATSSVSDGVGEMTIEEEVSEEPPQELIEKPADEPAQPEIPAEETTTIEDVAPTVTDEVSAFNFDLQTGYAVSLRAVGIYPLVVDTTTTPSVANDIETSVESIETQPADLPVESSEQIAEPVELQSGSEPNETVSDNTQVETEASVTADEPIAETAVTSSSSEESNVSDVAAETASESTSQSVVTTDEPFLELHNFDTPPLSPGQFVTGAQLRVSFAAQLTPDAIAASSSPMVEIYFGNATSATQVGVILLDEEVSNAVNGGYYLFALPELTSVSELEESVVRFTYVGDPDDLEGMFLDAAWLEVQTKQVTEEDIKARGVASNLKQLAQPHITTLVSERVNFDRSEAPLFHLRYNSQRNALVRGVRSFFGANAVDVQSVEITHRSLGSLGISPDVSVTSEGLLSISIPDNQLKNLRPGEYTVTLELSEGRQTYTETFDFEWGILTVNPNKSEYEVGETIDFSIGALTPAGHTVCEANLDLYVINPLGDIERLLVEESGQCNGNNVIDVPDFSAESIALEPGEHTVYLERLDDNGDVLGFVYDSFLVTPDQRLSIERTGPTRIYPPAPYPMTLTVEAKDTFVGVLTERVPSGFKISSTSADITDDGEWQTLSWDMSIRAGQTKTVSYQFDAPDLSPYLYELGPAALQGDPTTRTVEIASTTASTTILQTVTEGGALFTEHRQWKIASDAVGNMILFWDDGASIPTDWTCLSCGSGTFYQRFVMGSSTYNTTGGAATHTHTAVGSVLATSETGGESGTGDNAPISHTHSYTPVINAVSNLPEYRQLRVIQYSAAAGEPPTIPQGAIAIFDVASSSLPTNWNRYTLHDGRYIYGEDTPGTTGGSNTHTHTITGTTGTAGGSGTRSRGGTNNGALDTHTHTVSASTASVNNEPPYIEVVLAQAAADVSPTNGIIAMWTEEVGGGWIDVSSNPSDPFSGRFLKASTTYGTTGGGSSHTHADVTGITTSAPSAVNNTVTGAAGASDTHTHQVNVTGFSTDDNLPPYLTAVFGKRQGTDPVYEQLSSRWYVNRDNQTPTDPWPDDTVQVLDLVEREPITATSTPVKDGDEIRLRINAAVTNATSTAAANFQLQYVAASVCSAATGWADVGDSSSSTPWRGYVNSGVTDSSTLSSTLLASSTVAESYEETGYATTSPNEIAVDDIGEWDFVLQQNGADAGTNYCFRMVEGDGTVFLAYTHYPQLLTNYAPETNSLDALFDNEKTASTSPHFTFAATDAEGETVHYQIEVDNTYDFASPVITRDTISNATQFENQVLTSDKAPFRQGELIEFTPVTSLSNGTTYYWRVRATDPEGSNQWGEWSTIRSFTIDTGLTASAWFQTENEQFDVNTLVGVEATGDAVSVITGSTTGSMTSAAIVFADGTSGTAWDSLSFSESDTNNELSVQIEYYDGSTWALIPDTDLTGNSSGFGTSPVNLLGLDVTVYDTIRLVASYSGNTGSPALNDWTISWGYRVETPTITKLFANEQTGTTTPTFEFTTSDPQNDSLTYQVSWSTTPDFTASTTRTSDAGGTTGFANIDVGADTDPFNSGDTIQFTIQPADALTGTTTYWWRVRAKDTTGDNAYSFWTDAQSFTVIPGTEVSTWFQTTEEQFDSNILSGTIALPADSVSVATTASEALLVYGEGVQTEPRYRTWDGSTWSAEGTMLDIGAPVKWAVVRAGTTREEYIAVTVGTDADVNAQVFSTGEWGNLTELTPTMGNVNARGFDVVYETNSGTAMVVYCDGDAAPSYATWNGSTWSTPTAITLSSTNNCEWIKLAADPTSDEIVLMTRDSVGTAAASYEVLTWNGSTWTSGGSQGGARGAAYETMALQYEESGGQAIAVSGDGNPVRFEYNSWNGTAWAGLTTNNTISDNLIWAELSRDDGSDLMAMCYVDESSNIGVIRWTGAAWTGQTDLDAAGYVNTSRPVSCQYETTAGRDGNIMAVYSDATNARYRVWNGATWATEASISTIGTAASIQTTRTGVGEVMGLFFDDANDRLQFSHWDGSAWSTVQTLETDMSVDTSPYGEPFMLAPRNSGSAGTTIVSPSVRFADGVGPYWKTFSWNDTQPGTSQILYHLQYQTATGSWAFIPDTDLPGNVTGTTTGPFDLSSLNTNTYNILRPYAELSCDGIGNCPQILDWKIEWAGGITISGTAKQYDETSSTTAGTVAVAVNGVLQTGKTGTIAANGTWSISNVTVFGGDVVTIFVTGAADTNEAVAVTRYDGQGDMSGVALFERHLTLGSNDATTTPITNADIGLYDFTNNEDVFVDVTGTTLNICGGGDCHDGALYVGAGTYYTPTGRVVTHDFENNGTFTPGSNTIEIHGSWDNNATSTMTGSTVVFAATSTTETIDSTGVQTQFNNVTFGTTTGNGIWTLANTLDVNGNLTVNRGTLVRDTTAITVAGNLLTGTNGFWTGTGTTTFDGGTAATWNDQNGTLQNVGAVVVDGASKVVSLAGNVLAQSITIGANDTLDASVGNYDITIYGDWTNNNNFLPRSGEVFFAATSTSHTITTAGDAFYDLSFTGVGGGWAFSEPTVLVNNNFTVSAGTVTLPNSGTTTIAGSFDATGGVFQHNNSVLYFTSNVAETITFDGAGFTNVAYNLTFNGGGSWTIVDINATTSNDLRIEQGTVIFPTGVMAIGGTLNVTAGGFTAGTGTTRFYSSLAETLTVGGSSFATVVFDGTGSWSFADTNVAAVGDFLVTQGTVTTPSGTLSIGGSYSNADTVTAAAGTVRFNSADAGETVTFGGSDLYNVLFESATGGWTIVGNATTTNNFSLASSSDFMLQSGSTLSVGGVFTNHVGGASTTWTGTTLSLESSAYSINDKTNLGDGYDTLRVSGSAAVAMWNSVASTYTVLSGGSLYSQDHNGADGQLYIFGDYINTGGSEYWSYAVDFDGASLDATSSRAVAVHFADGATATLNDTVFSVQGSVTGSTTVANQGSGTYTLTISGGTTTAQYYEFTDLGTTGVSFTDAAVVSVLRDGSYTVAASGGTALTLSSTTIDANPAKQIFNITFATTTVIAANNVTQTDGAPTSYWWFRQGHGNLYGEAKDNDTGDPGSVRFDDSSLVLTIAGTVYADAGVTTLAGGNTCDGSTQVVYVYVEGNPVPYTGSCDNGTGAYSIGGVVVVGDPTLTIYLNDTPDGERGSIITRTPTADITDADIYANRVIVRNEDTEPLTIANLAVRDAVDDTDLQFVAATTTTPDTLIVAAGNELFVWKGSTFTPGGEVSLLGEAAANGYDGTLFIDDGATFNAYATSTLTIGGRLELGSNATFNAATTTVLMNATTTGKSITATSTITFNDLVFNGSGGSWNLGADIVVNGDMTITAGTVTGTGDITLPSGSLTGTGTLSLGGGTTTIAASNSLGGSTAWTFFNLQLGDTFQVGTTTPLLTSTTTVAGRLTIAAAHYLDAGATSWDLSGVGTVFVEDGTFLEDTSTVRYSGGGANVLSTQYYNLDINAGSGSQTYTATGLGTIVDGDLTIGGDATTQFDLNTNDPAFDVNGDIIVRSNGTLSSSDTGSFAIAGSYDNNGAFAGNGGTLTFDGSGVIDIAAGASSFSSVVVAATGDVTVSEHATATDTWLLSSANSFTLDSGQVLAVGDTFFNAIGGAATTWTGSTLHLYGGNDYSINAATTSDTYATLTVADTTQVRMWKSDATTYDVAATASLYSQDHAGFDGDLYIWGTYQKTNAADYWSYATDFDGTALGGSGRKVDVYLASGASVAVFGGFLNVTGATTASTTIQNQGSGSYSLTIGGTASTSMRYYEVRDIDSNGLTLTGTPTVVTLSNGDLEVSQNGGSAMTVGGTVINTNPAKNFTSNRFALNGVGSGFNVTATGTSVSAWRFTNHYGDIDGESFDVDPGGDPGYVAWDDSAALITISGSVYQDDGATVSGACDTEEIRLVVAGLSSATTTCNASTGFYSFSNVAYGPTDSIIVYINDASQKGASVTDSPVSDISSFDIYENHVIVRHENTDPITIADMATYDSSDDADIPFTAVDAGTDTLSLPADRKLIVWSGKTFAPGGNVTLANGGVETYGGSVALQAGAVWSGAGTESLTVGGSFEAATGAVFTASNGTTTFTTSGAGRVVDVNNGSFGNIAFTGSGSWTVTDATLSVTGSFAQSAGALTLPTGTTTVAGNFAATGGSFDANGGLVRLTGTGTHGVTLSGSSLHDLTVRGGTYTMLDTNATTTGDVIVESGTLVFPSGSLAVGGDLQNLGGSLTHNTSDVRFTATTTATILASSSDLYGVTLDGGGTYTFADPSVSLLGNFIIANGIAILAPTTTSVGGSFNASGGSFDAGSSTVLFNSSDTGEVVNPGTSSFYNVQIAAPTGGYTITANATATNNFVLASASNFVVQSGTTLVVDGVFLNSVGGSNTTWSGSTLSLTGPYVYNINSKSDSGDNYDTLIIGANADLRMWYSAATTTVIDAASSLYSQDNNGLDGHLYIYGDFHIATTTEYWSYATDFDGASLSGFERAVTVYHAANSTTTVDGGTLNIVGSSGNETTITNQGSGTYDFGVSAGTFLAQYYAVRNMSVTGLLLTGTPAISSLSYGDFELAVAGGTLISLSSTTLNANASLVITGNRFATTTAITGNNVTLTGVTSNAWTFTGHTGNLDGEDYDVDGGDACGSVRWSDSQCLITQQTAYRWRNDDGGESAPTAEWFDTNWDARQRVRITNVDAQPYTDAVVQLLVPYDSDMQSDYDDLRFTDSTGTTTIPYWVGSTTANVMAEVWVEVPSLPAEDTATIFMYYNNPTATSAASLANTFIAGDDFEDGNKTEYSGETSDFTVDGTFAYDGSYALDATSNETGRTESGGMYRLDETVSQGETLRFMQYLDVSESDESCVLFGVQSSGAPASNYGVCLDLNGTDRLVLVRNAVDSADTIPGVTLDSSAITVADGWYTFEIDWSSAAGGTIDVEMTNSAGSSIATLSATDSNYTSGGYGFTFWFQHGGWDSFSSRPTLTTEPSYVFGVKQGDGGASWAAAENTRVIVDPNATARLRLAIENSGLDITNQQFRLEYAGLGAAPSCEAVDASNYQTVPLQASCAGEPVCMQSSTQVTNGVSTVDLLTSVDGVFTPGQLREDPSNTTAAINVDQGEYTELEYVITPTLNVVDENLCFRVTNAGTDFDTYLKVARLTLRFDPVLGAITLNEGYPISLLPGTTTAVYATTTVTDLNGYTDIVAATSTFYRSGVAGGASCTPDNNNCYVASGSQCQFTNCSGNTCDVECRADIYFHADPTDTWMLPLINPYDGEEWFAFIEVEDTNAGYDFDTSIGQELLTMRAIDVEGAIDYGALEVNSDTGGYNASTTIENFGNVEADVEITGSDLFDGYSSSIPSDQQKFATTTFTYSSCGASCELLSSTTPINLDIDLSKPTTSSPYVTDDIFWGIAIPFGINSAPHQGINVFTPVSP